MTQKELLGLDWIPEAEFATLRELAVSTLQKERSKKPYGGPPYAKDGQSIFYSATGYREWLQRQMHEEQQARPRRRR